MLNFIRKSSPLSTLTAVASARLKYHVMSRFGLFYTFSSLLKGPRVANRLDSISTLTFKVRLHINLHFLVMSLWPLLSLCCYYQISQSLIPITQYDSSNSFILPKDLHTSCIHHLSLPHIIHSSTVLTLICPFLPRSFPLSSSRLLMWQPPLYFLRHGTSGIIEKSQLCALATFVLAPAQGSNIATSD